MRCEGVDLCASRRAFTLGALAFLGGGAALRPRPADANALRVGAPAPAATLVTLEGARLATPELTGKVVLLTFWATWCAPCREELPLLSRYALAHREDLQVLGFSLDTAEQLAEVRRIAATLAFPVGLFERSSAPGYGRIWRLPVSFLIDRQGRLAMDGWQEKPPTLTAARLETLVTPLLGAGGAVR
ncbi:MAG: TlpA family protein disulfide reductase [Gammaproteobacteria bacterium]|nr:TlpA family protein disulfide reductase [Gammaproteobacteria bacterium]